VGGYTVFPFFGMRTVTSVVSQASIAPSLITLLKMVAKYVCVATSCLRQKLAISSLPAAFQFSVALNP
jgi:hypothetical protein